MPISYSGGGGTDTNTNGAENLNLIRNSGVYDRVPSVSDGAIHWASAAGFPQWWDAVGSLTNANVHYANTVIYTVADSGPDWSIGSTWEDNSDTSRTFQAVNAKVSADGTTTMWVVQTGGTDISGSTTGTLNKLAGGGDATVSWITFAPARAPTDITVPFYDGADLVWQLQTNGADGDGLEQTLEFADEPLLYQGGTISAQVETAGSCDHDLHLLDQDDNVIGTASNTDKSATAWKVLTLAEQTIGANDTAITFQIVRNDASNNNDVYMRRPQLNVGAAVAAYRPRGWTFRGANATSTSDVETIANAAGADTTDTAYTVPGSPPTACAAAITAFGWDDTAAMDFGFFHGWITASSNTSANRFSSIGVSNATANVDPPPNSSMLTLTDSQQFKYTIDESGNNNATLGFTPTGFYVWEGSNG